MERRTIALLLVIATVVKTSSPDSCPDDTFLSDQKLCCLFCPEGTFLTEPCNESRGRSTCEPCPPGTFMDKENRGSKCEQCVTCEPSQIVLEPCTSTQNTECGCEPGKFFDGSFLFCMGCAECGKGYGVETPCQGSQNTVCQPCRKGTFSNTQSFKDACIECSSCDPPMMVVKQPCSSESDTICERVSNKSLIATPTQTFSSVRLPSMDSGNTKPPSVDGTQKIPYIVGISVLAALFVLAGVLGIYCKKRLCSRTEGEAQPNIGQEETSVPFIPETSVQTPAQSRSSHGLRGRHVHNSRQSDNSDSQGSSGSLQGVSIGNGKKKTLVRDLPSDVYYELAQLLNPTGSNNWERLAGKLGFTQTEVRNFQLVPEQCTQQVLQQWSQRNDATVDVLIKHLKDMKREDCVAKLKPWDTV